MEKHYNHVISEQEAQQLWEKNHVYSAQHNPGPLLSIDTPPPTVSGSLHIGHIFSYTQTDILARYARMNGYSVFYPFGFDDNGLATERFVEKVRDIKAHQMPRSEFIAQCLEETTKAQQSFRDLWQRIGLSVDWDLCYSTIAPSTRKISQQSFIALYQEGHVYRKQEPALYCTNCRTSVAQAELDDKDIPSIFYTIAFKDKDNNDLLIGTTRPELLSSCVSLFYHPSDERYQYLKDTYATVPLFNIQVPIIADELVIKDKGTGLVMCCTFGDKTDIEWYKKYNFAYRQSIGLDGKWIAQTGFLAGLNATQARAAVIEALNGQQLVRDQKPIVHSVNTHERCQKEIEYVVLSQWFIKIIDLKKQLIELADNIEWYPSFMKIRYQNWVENIGWDWCISRQRFYGIPFPAWHCMDCDAILLAKPNWLPIDPQETPYPGKTCSHCASSNIKPDTDVMDTWNTSSLTPYICAALSSTQDPFANSDNFIPMGMRPQAHDIIRTWAFYTIIKTWLHNKTIPWKKIVISGHVLSSDKEKLSKSKGNNPLAPENLLSQYSADAIRYWTASGRLGSDITFSDSQIKIGQRLVTKLWNAFRFAHPHITDFNPSATPLSLGMLNEWILDSISTCFSRYQHYFAVHEFSLALHEIEQFFWHDYCDNYLELIKHQLFNPGSYTPEELYATRWTLYQMGLRILQLYAPYVPYITEAIYGLLYRGHEENISLHATKFSQMQILFSFEHSRITSERLIHIITQVRKLKTEKQASLKTELRELALYGSTKEIIDSIKSLETILQGATHAQIISYHTSALAASQLIETDGLLCAQVIINDNNKQ